MTPAEVQARIDQHLKALTHLYGLLNQRRPTGDQLTPRELQVLTLRVATPMTLRQVGRALGVTEDAVKGAAKRGWVKLGVTRADQLPEALARVTGVAA